ncbi:hypothetical protein KCU67_g6797, partial [Aureobasidium melanogenum]
PPVLFHQPKRLVKQPRSLLNTLQTLVNQPKKLIATPLTLVKAVFSLSEILPSPLKTSTNPAKNPLSTPTTWISSLRALEDQESHQLDGNTSLDVGGSHQASQQANDGLSVPRNQELESDEEDDTPIMQPRQRRKRRLQPDSDSEGQESESDRYSNPNPPVNTSTTASTSVTPASIPSTSASTGAPASTACANNPPASTKPINRRIADDFASTATGMIFSCPVPNCGTAFIQSYTIDSFYRHTENDTHLKHFYDTRSHPCHFGCEKGFLNELALHRHVQQLMCEEAQDLSEAIKNCSICSATFPDALGELVRWEHRHGHVLANTNSLCHCTPCNINFPTKELFWGHMSLVSGRGDSHHMVTKSHDL